MLRSVVLLSCLLSPGVVILAVREQLSQGVFAEQHENVEQAQKDVVTNEGGPFGIMSGIAAALGTACPSQLGHGGRVDWKISHAQRLELESHSDFCRQYLGGPQTISFMHDAILEPISEADFDVLDPATGKNYRAAGQCPANTLGVVDTVVEKFTEKMKRALPRSAAGDDEEDMKLGMLSVNQFADAVMNFIKVDVHMDWLEKVEGMKITNYLMTLNSPRWAIVQSCESTPAGCAPLSAWYVFLIGTFPAEVGYCAIWFKAPVQKLHCLTTRRSNDEDGTTKLRLCNLEDGTTKMNAVSNLEWGLEAYDGDLGFGSTIPDAFIERVISSHIEVQ